MGEVYRARDTRLGREVAVKVSHEQFSERFEREARAVAALNHPNICALYDVGPNYLVMELVEGETLRGPLPLAEALRIGSQIIEALEAAHEKGIIHRDLKPANIKITPEGVVKVLDFGLAKALEPERVGTPENSPTLTLRATQVGMILGTAAYMAPEQARGQDADKRSDIWSFGAVLYELATGRRAFDGDTISDVLAAVLKSEPDWARVPPQLQRLLRKCLEKDPRKRLQAIGDARLLIEDTRPAQAVPAARTRILPWAVAALLFVALAAVSWIAWRATQPIDHPLMRLNVDLGSDSVVGQNVTAAISPDGKRTVFPVRGANGKQLLATRLLDQATAAPLNGTENGFDPFFSPDGQWVAFFADGKLKKISVQGGAAFTLCDAPIPRGASWGEDGIIIAALNTRSELVRIPAAGGEPQRLTQFKAGEATHRWPQVLPGGNVIVFMSSGSIAEYNGATIEALSIKTGERKTLWRGGYSPRYFPVNGSSGFLTFLHQGVLFGVSFDAARLQLRGTPVPLLEDVPGRPGTGGGQLDLARNGTLVYLSGQAAAGGYPIVWLDASGKTQPLLSKPGPYSTFRLSPDGQRLAVGVSAGANTDIWLYDSERDSMTRLSFIPGDNRWPVWTPDGKHIVFRSSSSGRSSIDWIRADGAGEVQKLLESENDLFPNSFSPDGHRLAFMEGVDQSRYGLSTLPLDLSEPEHPKAGKSEVFLSNGNNSYPSFSPDGRWIAYLSNESGSLDIYVRPFPGPGGKWQISTGGAFPIWSRNGRELFYETPFDNRIMVTEYTAPGDSFLAGKPRPWSDRQIFNTGTAVTNLDLAPDGKRFAVLQRPDAADESKGSAHVIFLLNFLDELRRRVPAGK